MKLAICFPGQGSQYVGMVKPLTDNFNWTREIFEEASESIKQDIYRLSLDGLESDLQLTFNAQPAILTTAYAWYRVLQKELDLVPVAGGGHSLGEYTALLSSGALSLSSAVKLVRTRGELMQEAVPVGVGAMAAVIGLEDDKINSLCEAASDGDSSRVVGVNFNAPGQVVIAGHKGAVERAQKLSSDKKNHPDWAARKFVLLNVSAPFHSPLMTPVATKFESALSSVSWASLTFPISFNVDAKLRMTADYVSLLKAQVDHPVLWVDCVKSLIDEGVTHFIEPGPSKVLSGLGKRIDRNYPWINIESKEDLLGLEKLIKETK